MISAEGLCKRLGKRSAVDGLTFAVPQGEVFGFVGSNGAGKTTTIRILATLLPPDQGDAHIGGVSVRDDPTEVRALIGYMPDFFGVYPRLTAEEYLLFYAGVHRLRRSRRRAVVDDLLDVVGLADLRHDDVDGLSRGHKQRLCLARALVHDPPVLLLDEPASGLDPPAQVEFRELVRELRDMGKTILVSSHHLPELEEMCSWVGLIERGRMLAVGPIDDVRNHAGSERRLRVELADPAPGERETALGLARSFPGVTAAEAEEADDDRLELAVDASLADHELLAHLVGQGVKVRSLTPARPDLAEAFLRLTAEPR